MSVTNCYYLDSEQMYHNEENFQTLQTEMMQLMDSVDNGLINNIKILQTNSRELDSGRYDRNKYLKFSGK